MVEELNKELTPEESDYIVGAASYVVMRGLDQRMDEDLANAKNKRGICQKYKHSIPPRAWKDPEEAFDVGPLDWRGTPYAVACVAIGMLMRERLEAFANQHGIDLYAQA